MMWLLFGKFYRIIIYEKFLGCGMGKEILTEQRISDDCKKAIRRFFWRSIILIAVAPIAILIPYLIHILEQFTEEGFPRCWIFV